MGNFDVTILEAGGDPAEIIKAVCDFAPFIQDNFYTKTSVRDAGIVKAYVTDENPKNEMAEAGLFVLDDRHPITKTPDVVSRGIPTRPSEAYPYVKEQGGRVFHGRFYQHGGIAYSLSSEGVFADSFDSGPLTIVASKEYVSQYKEDELEKRVAKDLEWVNDAHAYGLFTATGMQCQPNGDLVAQGYWTAPFIGDPDGEMAPVITAVHDDMRASAGMKADAPLTPAQQTAQECMHNACRAMGNAGGDSHPIVDTELGIIIIFNSIESPSDATEARIFRIPHEGLMNFSAGNALHWREWTGVQQRRSEVLDIADIEAAVLRAREGLGAEASPSP